MIGLVQRVNHAEVIVDKNSVSRIEKGLLLLLGIEKNDDESKIPKLAKKIAKLRIFEDNDNKMNLSLLDIKGQLLVVSQFTLAADTSRGNRPGFSNAADPSISESLYHDFINYFSLHYLKCEQGQFGANMQIDLVNDGPATFYLQV